MYGDFGLLPPEIISAQLTTGPGSTPLLQAAQAWQQLAAERQAAAVAYQAQIAGLNGSWRGPSADRMTAAATQYHQWLQTTADWCAQMAQQSYRAAEAHSLARTDVIPLAQVLNNCTQLIQLIAANLLGQNTAAIGQNQLQYIQMWAHNNAVMAQYQTSSQAATAGVTPLAAPAATTSPLSALLGTSNPVDLFNSYVEALISSGFPMTILQLFASMWGTSAIMSAIASATATSSLPALPIKTPVVAGATGTASATGATIRSSIGSAPVMGRLSVPPGWTQQIPKVTPQPTRSIPSSAGAAEEGAKLPIGLPVLPAVPVVKATKPRGSDPDSMPLGKPLPTVLFRHPSGG